MGLQAKTRYFQSVSQYYLANAAVADDKVRPQRTVPAPRQRAASAHARRGGVCVPMAARDRCGADAQGAGAHHARGQDGGKGHRPPRQHVRSSVYAAESLKAWTDVVGLRRGVFAGNGRAACKRSRSN